MTDNMPVDSLTPSEALFGFVAWLATREDVLTVGRELDPTPLGEAVRDFCAVNRLSSPREGWENLEIRYPVQPKGKTTPLLRPLPSSVTFETLRSWRDSVVARAVKAGMPQGIGLCDWFEGLARELQAQKHGGTEGVAPSV